MFVSENLSTNAKGRLMIGGVDTVALAAKYGTPLYVMDEDLIRHNCRLFQDSIDKYYDGNGMVCYASKAFSCLEIYRIMKSENMGIDVVSGGELYTAIRAGFDVSRAVFHGNNKSDEEMRLALDNGVGRIVVDNRFELERLDAIAKEKNITAPVLLRIKPGVDAHTHNFIRTGQIDSKFGFALETGEAFKATELALSYDNINLRGFHCHIGSQILDTQAFEAAAQIMMEFIEKVTRELHVDIADLNLGGGFGIRYTLDDDPPSYDAYMCAVAKVINAFCEEHCITRPYIMIEPGRSIVAPAGITLYTIGCKKTIPRVRTYISVDGGMCDNPRYILYQSEYDAVIANKAERTKAEKVTIAGKCCESGDLIGENVPLQTSRPGDILAICATGAYNYSMASNYNRIQKPPVVFVKDGEDRLVIRRETLDDLLKCDL